MRHLLLMLAVLSVGGLALPACEKPAPAPPSSDGTTDPNAITGRERLGWDQRGPSEELQAYSYVLYVDGNPVVLQGVACTVTGGDEPSHSCSAPLPTLSTGRHTLELATRVERNGTLLESDRSAPMIVTVTGLVSAGAVGVAVPRGLMFSTRDGGRYVAEVVAAALDRPSALAFAPDGRVFIAEAGGRVRVMQEGELLSQPALTLSEQRPGDQAEISAIAFDDEFSVTRLVYVGYVLRDADGSRKGRVVSFREEDNALHQPSVLVDDLSVDYAPPRVRVGPDGALYVGTSDTVPTTADDAGSYAGKLLRLSRGGFVPDDNPRRFSPLLSAGHVAPFDFDWEPGARRLWQVETLSAGVRLGRTVPGGSVRARGERGATIPDVHVNGAAFYDGVAIESFRGDLFLASLEDECLYWVRDLSASTSRPPVIEPVVRHQFGRIAAVASGPDGLYFTTSNGDGRAAPLDLVVRIRRGVSE